MIEMEREIGRLLENIERERLRSTTMIERLYAIWYLKTS